MVTGISDISVRNLIQCFCQSSTVSSFYRVFHNKPSSFNFQFFIQNKCRVNCLQSWFIVKIKHLRIQSCILYISTLGYSFDIQPNNLNGIYSAWELKLDCLLWNTLYIILQSGSLNVLGIQTMKQELKQAIVERFINGKTIDINMKVLRLATLLDPRYKAAFFKASNYLKFIAKKILLP